MTNQHLSKILVYQLLERTFWPKTWLQAHLKSCLQSNLVKGDESNVDNDGQNKSNGNNKNGDGDIDGKVLTLDYDESENDFAGPYLVWEWFCWPLLGVRMILLALTWCEASDCNILAAAPSDSWVGFLLTSLTQFHLSKCQQHLECRVWSLKFWSFEESIFWGASARRALKTYSHTKLIN